MGKRWKCEMVEKRDLKFFKDGKEIEWSKLPVGSMWFSHSRPKISQEKPILDDPEPLLSVRLPGLIDWCIDRPGSQDSRWTRTGNPPDISTQPSINFVGLYHGYISEGYVTDDYDGRKFNDDGTPIKA